MRIAVCGSLGRMGQLVIRAATELKHEIVNQIDRTTERSKYFAGDPDICIDFSSPSGLLSICSEAAKRQLPVVSGTTGLTVHDMDQLKSYAKGFPLLISSNFSIGVYVLRGLVKKAATELPDAFDIEIMEKHHNKKKDSPSGTALSILQDIKDVKEISRTLFGRSGNTEHQAGEIGIHAVRGGDIVGEHTVYFLGNGESIEISHRATNREVFARGAIWVAENFLKFKEPGIYGLSDIF